MPCTTTQKTIGATIIDSDGCHRSRSLSVRARPGCVPCSRAHALSRCKKEATPLPQDQCPVTAPLCQQGRLNPPPGSEGSPTLRSIYGSPAQRRRASHRRPEPCHMIAPLGPEDAAATPSSADRIGWFGINTREG